MHIVDFHYIHHHFMHTTTHSYALVEHTCCLSRGSGPMAGILCIDCQCLLCAWHGLVSSHDQAIYKLVFKVWLLVDSEIRKNVLLML